ncbi:serine hydrolase [Streptomyces sp. NPDC127068]|uniref:serine hydrolase n=1 Tax=Streptomyces sp. NPDC127068 TaxID=3347127 RepID=UPI00365992DC
MSGPTGDGADRATAVFRTSLALSDREDDAPDAPAEARSGPSGAAEGSASPVDGDTAAEAAEGRTEGSTGSGGEPQGDEGPEGAPADDASDTTPPRDPGSASPPEADESAEAETEAEAGGGDAGETDHPDDSDAESTTAAADEPSASTTESSTEDSTDTDTDADDGDSDGSGVDQATGIFRMPAPRVDQPTTTLKLGDVTEPTDDKAPKGDEPSDPDAAPVERDQERTSKFVALKPLDEPAAPRRPAAKPSWATATATAAEPDSAADPSTTTGTGTGTSTGAGARPAPDGSAGATSAMPAPSPEFTTQQPLPPKPPLDLLAELTNTPPPRQTPLRTAARRVKIWTPLVLLLVVVFAVAQMIRPLPEPSLTLTAKQTFTFEGEEVSLPWPEEGHGWMDVNGVGTMAKFGEQKPVPIGSVAKAMTAYVILKEHPLKPGAAGPKIPVDAKAEQEGGLDSVGESTLNTLKEGDRITLEDAISAIMIPSANNIARLLARWDSSEKEFVAKMNQAAKDLGMEKTTYTDPSGLNETTVSTAEDQVKLGNELVRMKALTDITKLPVWTDQTGKEWQNYNRLVPYDGALGIKTGTTTKAGGNLLFAGTKEVGGETAIVVGAILGQHKPPIIDTVNAVSKTAMIAAQGEVRASTILKKGAVVGYVDDGLGTRTPVVVTKDVSAVGFAGHTVKVELSAGEDLTHEAAAGARVGTLKVGDGSSGAVEVPIALQSATSEPGFGAKITRLG